MNSSADLLEYAGGFQALKEAELRVALPVVLGVICLVGLAGNTMVVAVLMHDFRQAKSSVANGLIVLLSATDLLILLFCAPLRAVTYSRPSWSFGWLLCKSSDYFLQACLSAKSFTLAAVGHARYQHVAKPKNYIDFKCRRLVALTCSIWSLSCLLPIPHWLFADLRRRGAEISCVLEIPAHAWHFMTAFGVAYPLAVYLMPVSFAMACLVRALVKSKPGRNRTPNRRYEIRRVTVMLLVLSGAFAVMRLPEWVAWTWSRHRGSFSPGPPTALLVLGQVLTLANCTVNPFVLLAASEDFKDGVRSAWAVATRRGAGGQARTSSFAQKVCATIPHSGAASSLCALPTISAREDVPICRDLAQNIPPDVQHFWQHRKNAAPVDNNDPVPWESQEQA
ncbi:G-protein coupled receptor 151-like [Hypanus sabinus]|uniref:G-protein coupled receptor 151-like n=1 Tax=Hypanus sabinus TaxID=79690 RepID=UPI0028C39F4C|nr:G-protein coupled receptor 151-like [Hypanus sabinus]